MYNVCIADNNNNRKNYERKTHETHNFEICECELI